MNVNVIHSEVVKRAMVQKWAMVMGDDDQYEGPGDNIVECIKWGHTGQEKADYGTMWFRLSPYDALEVRFNITPEGV